MDVLAHAGQPVAPHDLVGALRTVEPWALVLLAVGALVYRRGSARLWRGEAGRRALPRWRAWCFAGAEVVLFLAVVWPLDAMAGALFGAHMLQHLLLTLLVAPLLVLSRPVLVGTMAFPVGRRRPLLRLRRWVAPTSSTVRAAAWAAGAVVVHVATMWVWHVPGLYELAVRSEPVHVLEHGTLLLGAVPFWWLVLDARARHANGVGVVAVFVALLASGALAGLISFSGSAWYDVYGGGPAAWGLDPIQDQELAGGLLWFPGGLAYVIAGAAVFLRWLKEDERSASWDALREVRGERV